MEKNVYDSAHNFSNILERVSEINLKIMGATTEQMKAVQTYWNGVLRYVNEFVTPYWTTLGTFNSLERGKLMRVPPWESIRDYLELLQFNLQIAQRGLTSSLDAMNEYHTREYNHAFSAWLNTILCGEGEDIEQFKARQAKLIEKVVYAYPKAIRDIESEFGFHFDDGGYIKTAETDRFCLYQVLPRNEGIEVRQNGKPVIIVPPYVLGANILAFLPGEERSYVHCFANQGIPTYIRILKDIDTTPAVQVMTGEDDALDTRFFCEQVKARHGRPVTLNGFCQGGYITLLDLLSGQLDGLVDAHITCVAPIDGTRSKALGEYLEHIPSRFRDMGYARKTLPNGNQVVDGKVMSWVYKLKSMEKEAPIFTFYRDLMMFDTPEGQETEINKTAAAINHWLIYDRKDLPVAITQMSFDSYAIPISKDGTLPVKFFGQKLNFKHSV